MKSKIEKLLDLIADTQKIAPHDRLTETIEACNAEELDEDTLDLVFAAKKPDFSKLWGLINKNDKRK